MSIRIIGIMAVLVFGSQAVEAVAAGWGPMFMAHHPDTTRHAVLQGDEEFWRAAGEHDIATLDRLTADDYLGQGPDGASWNKSSILAQHKAYRIGELVRDAPPVVHCVHPDAAMLSYSGTFSLRDSHGALICRAHQRMLSCWVRNAGKWQVAFADVTTLPDVAGAPIQEPHVEVAPTTVPQPVSDVYFTEQFQFNAIKLD